MSMPPSQQFPGQPWGQQPPPNPPRRDRPWYKKKRFIIPLGFFAFVIVVAIVSPDPEPDAIVANPPAASEPAVTTKNATKKKAAEPTTKAPKPVVPEVSQEDKFIALIEKARDEASDADNDFQRRLPLTKRDKAICKLLDSKRVSNWTGELTDLNTNGDGLGVLEIEIADDIKIATWNNALSDFEDNTLIKTSSPIFDTMGTLNEGDQVKFSGTLIRDSESCIAEQSITDQGSTNTPTFTMKFSKLAKS